MIKPLNSYLYFTISSIILLNPCLGQAEDKEISQEELASFFLYHSNPKTSDASTQNQEEIVDKCYPGIHSQAIYLKHIEGKGVGYKKGYTTLGAFLTPATLVGSVMPFIDLRGHVFDDGKMAANAGGGARYLSHSTPWILGANFFYDYRQSHRKGNFHQLSGGLEFLFPRWEFRINGYMPVGEDRRRVGHTKDTSLEFSKFVGHFLYFNQNISQTDKFEFAMKGADAEMGAHLIKPNKNYTLYLGVGPYYYKGDFGKATFGGKARLFTQLNRYISFEVSDSFDHIFRNNFQGQMTLSLPFGKKYKTRDDRYKSGCDKAFPMLQHLMEPPHRQEMIVLDKHSKRQHSTINTLAIDPTSGNPFYFLFVDNTVPLGGSGTFERRFDALNSAQAASSVGDIIYAFEGDRTTTGMDQGIALQNRQSLFGSGMPHQLTTQKGVITIPAFTAGRPSITQATAFTNVVTLANNNTLAGFNISKSNQGNGIVGIAINNSLITNNVISIPGGNSFNSGISFVDITGTHTIAKNSIDGNSVSPWGIILDETGSNSATLILQKNAVTGWTNNASIFLTTEDTSQLTLVLEKNNISFNPGSGGFTGAGVWVVTQDASKVNATVTNNLFSNNQNNGFAIISNNTSEVNATFIGNSFANTSGILGNGFEVDINGTNIMNLSFSQNSFSNNGRRGIDFNYSSTAQMTANISQNIITGCASEGIGGANSFNGTFIGTIANNTLSGNGGTGDISLSFATSSANLKVNSNTSAHAINSLIFRNTGLGSMCQQMNRNIATSDYALSNTGGGTFNLELPLGNIGNIQTAGITIVPSGACSP